MPAKQIQDLPQDAIIEIRYYKNGDVSILAVDSAVSPYYNVGEIRQLLGIKMEPILTEDTQTSYYRVTNSEAQHGYGPLAYDLALEFASLEGRCGLITGTGLTNASRKIWEVYRDNRPDVLREPIEHGHLLSKKVDPAFRWIWKKPIDLLPQLEHCKKLSVIHGIEDLIPTSDVVELDPQVAKLLAAMV